MSSLVHQGGWVKHEVSFTRGTDEGIVGDTGAAWGVGWGTGAARGTGMDAEAVRGTDRGSDAVCGVGRGASGPRVAFRQSLKYLQMKRGRVEQSRESYD
jgi:hypothetical protein